MIWSPGNTLEEVEKTVILKALSFYQGNKTHTAKSLGISIRTLDAKLNQYNDVKPAEPAELMTWTAVKEKLEPGKK